MKFEIDKDVHLELTENDPFANHSHITILEGEYEGLKFRYGDVKLEEVGEGMKVSFHFDILEGKVEDEEAFGQYIGSILFDIVNQQLQNQELVFAGGVDGEN